MNKPIDESEIVCISPHDPPPPASPDLNTVVTEAKGFCLFWRRLAAIAIDLLMLDILLYIGRSLGSLMVGVVLSWFAFFILWYLLENKKNITVGKAIVQIHSVHANENTDKSQCLLIRFAITWLPLLILYLPLYEYSQYSQPLIVTFLQLGIFIWYLVLLIRLVATKGHTAPIDTLSGYSVELTNPGLLSPKRKTIAWAFVVALALETGVTMLPPSDMANPNPNLSPFASEDGGFPFESLKLTAHTVYGSWKEKDLLFDDKAEWSGTASVISRDQNKLYLASNSHVLGLESLAKSDDDGDAVPEVHRYSLEVEFASGKKSPVLRFADEAGTLDLSILEVDATDLSEGKDYFIVPFDNALDVKVGDEAVAVGSPHGLSGTHTFGRISAIREFNQGYPYRVLQTDAAINPGNSGGPLFIKQGSKFKWAGVNTFLVGSDNLGFAIDARHVWDSKYMWFPTNPRGAADAIKSGYNRKAVVE